MTRRAATIIAGSGFAGFLFNVPFGPRPVAEASNDLGAQMIERLQANHTETKGLITKAGERIGAAESTLGEVKDRLGELDGRIADAEQKAARRGGLGAPPQIKSWGQRFIDSAEYKDAEGRRDRQGSRIQAVVASTELEHKNITSVATSGGSLVPTDRRLDPAMLPWIVPSVRDLCAPGTTESNAVSYPRQKTRVNNAAMVAEGALKPQSDMDFEEVTAPVRTLAHFFLASRQILDDAPALAAMIDAEARAGLADVEDAQLLFGSGGGQDLFGLVPQASLFVKQWNVGNSTPLDVLIQAIAQVEAQNWSVDGMVLNAVDWRRLQSIRDMNGQYIGNSPFEAEVARRIWNTPVAATNRMPQGKFLVGPFRTQAQIFDRMGVEVVASSEDGDNFRRNLVTLRAEERLAFTVKRPGAFVTGDLTASLTN